MNKQLERWSPWILLLAVVLLWQVHVRFGLQRLP